MQGLRNDFKDAMDKVDQQYLEEMVKGHGEDENTKAYDIKLHEDGTTMEELLELSQQVGTEENDNKLVTKFIRVCLREGIYTWKHQAFSNSNCICGCGSSGL